MTSYANHAQKMLSNQSGASDGSKRFRDEYIETLQANSRIGTTRGGNVSQYGFPAAADLLIDLGDVDASGESVEHKHLAPAAQPKPVEAKPMHVHSLEQFATMLEVMQSKQPAAEPRTKVVA